MKRFHALILLIAASAALASNDLTDYPETPDYPDYPEYPAPDDEDSIIHGELTCHSVLIYSGHINGSSFEWHGHNQISRIEVQRPDACASELRRGPWWEEPAKEGPELRVRGGVEYDYLQVWSTDGAAFNATVKIYSEPRNLTVGFRDDDGKLVHSERISGEAPLRFRYSGNASLQAVELWDRTNGTGAFIARHDEPTEGTIELTIGSDLFRGRIDFEVSVFADSGSQPGPRPGGRNVEVGKLLNGSEHIETSVLRIGDLELDDGFFSRTFDNYTVDFARFTDLSKDGKGHIFFTDISVNILAAWFDLVATTDIVYLLEVYGRPFAAVQDITVGELRPSSVILEDILVIDYDTTVTVVRRLRWPIDRIEVRNSGSGAGVHAELLRGEVGGSLLVVTFTAEEPQNIVFTVKVWGSKP